MGYAKELSNTKIDENTDAKKNYKIALGIILVNILIITLFIFIVDKDQPKKQTFIKKTKEIKDVPLWNLMYKKGKVNYIDKLIKTSHNTYALSGVTGNYNVFIQELSSDAKELNYKIFSNNINIANSTLIEVDDGYILSYKSKKYKNHCYKLDHAFNIIYQLPIHFNSMTKTNDGFIGVTQTKIIKISHDGNIIWQKDLNRGITQKKTYYTYHNGTRKEKLSTIKSTNLKNIIKLKDKNFIALGYIKPNKFQIIKFTNTGEIIFEEILPTVKTLYLRDAIATQDGGFIALTSGPHKIFKFNSEAKVEWSKKILKNRRDFGKTIIETDDGYITIGEPYNTNNISIIKLDKNGNILWKKTYKNHKHNMRSKNIIQAFDGGFLMNVDIETSNSWLVKMNHQGIIECDFKEINSKTVKKISKLNTTSNKKLYLKQLFDFTGTYSKLKISKDEKYIYSIAGGSGFQIIDIHNYKNPILLSRFLKTKAKIKISENGVIYKADKTEPTTYQYQYDSPSTFILSEDKNLAIIADRVHGVYILDIKDKKHPKLLSSLKNIISNAIELSSDATKLYIADVNNKLHIVDIKNSKKPKILNNYNISISTPNSFEYSNYISDILFLNPSTLLISNDKNIIVFDIKQEKIINIYETLNRIYDIELDKQNRIIYASMGDSGIDIINFNNRAFPKNINTINIAYPISSSTISPKHNLLFGSSHKGSLIEIDISNKKNPKITKIYNNISKASPRSSTLSKNQNRLFIAHGVIGVGVIDLKE
jgi:hypothetical protein